MWRFDTFDSSTLSVSSVLSVVGCRYWKRRGKRSNVEGSTWILREVLNYLDKFHHSEYFSTMETTLNVIYSCKYPECRSVAYRHQKNQRFYKFPKDVRRQKLWKEICNIKEDVRCNDFRICENHFTGKDFLNERLNKLCPFAVPKAFVFSCDDHTYCKPKENVTISEEVVSVSNNTDVEKNCSGIVSVSSNSVFGSVDEQQPSCSFWNLETVNDAESQLTPNLEKGMECTFTDPATCTSAVKGKGVYSFLSDEIVKGSKRKGFLSKIWKTFQDLTPTKQLMYNIHRGALARISKLKTLLSKERDHFKKLKTLYDSNQFEVIDESLNLIRKEFINCQLKNHNRKPPAKRYTNQFKLFALSMYKRSPRLYRYLQVNFELPCPRVLKRLLNSVQFNTGFNNNLLVSLKSQVMEMHDLDRFCTLLFDEMKLSDAFYYEKSRQMIVGYEDLGHLGRTMRNADHAFVLMARGLRRRWKQPIAYYFTTATISTVALKQIIVKAIQELKLIGLVVVGTVCDQGATNRAAINQLCLNVGDTPSMCHFKVEGDNIDCMFDPGHLMKSTRNALIENLIEFEEGKFANFDHIIMLFELDQKKKFKSLHSLCREHFNFKNSYNKMKVNVACRQLSYTVACELETYVAHNVLPSAAAHTAEFVHLIDELFDSVNGFSKFPKRSDKELRCAVRNESPHIEFWQNLLPKLNRWKIINKTTGKDVTNQFHFLNGWKVTIRSMISIWRRVEAEGFEYLCPRVLNQDPLENLFCCIRQHGIANTNPTCYQFVAALKTCVLNNLVMPRYVQSNCKDDGDSLLNNLTALLKTPIDQNESFSNTNAVNEDDSFNHEDVFNQIVNVEDSQALAYVSGYIVKKMSLPDCASCKDAVLSKETTPSHVSIMFRDMDGEHLTYPTETFMNLVNGTNELLSQFLKLNGNKDLLEELFKSYCMTKETFQSFFNCPNHNVHMINDFFKICVPFLIYKFINDSNKGLEQASCRALGKHLNKMKKLTSRR